MVHGVGRRCVACVLPSSACRCCLLSPNRHDEFSLGLSVLYFYLFFCLLRLSTFFFCNTNEHALIHNNNDKATEAQTLTHARTQFSLIEHIWTFSIHALNSHFVEQLLLQFKYILKILSCKRHTNANPRCLTFVRFRWTRQIMVCGTRKQKFHQLGVRTCQYVLYFTFSSLLFNLFFVYCQSNCLRDGRFSGEPE